MIVTGEFNVSLKPLDAYAEGGAGVTLGRMSIDKVFTGTLDATSKGEMLSARTMVDGSAGYVAIEQVHGSLDGKLGSFVLQHYGTMSKGSDHLILEVIPDSATGELHGLTGEMEIRVEDGKHIYDFDFTLPADSD